MSLLKRLALSARKLEANQANAHLSRGPVTAEGIERIRDAQLIHGFYSKAPGEAMRVLGEKPDDFERLVDSLTATWQPETDYELVLVRRLARALWLLERADRIQEGMTVNQMERVSQSLEERAERESARHKQKIATLERLLEQCQQIGFGASVADLDEMQQMMGRRPQGRQGDILYLLYRLMRPSDPAASAVAEQVAKIDAGPNGYGALGGGAEPGSPGGGDDPRASALAPATGKDRDRLRSQLRSLVRQEIEAEHVAYRQHRDQSARELTMSAMDASMATDHPRAEFMLRSEAAAFRQVKQLTEMLMQFQQRRGPEKRPPGRPPNGRKASETPPEINSAIENDGKSHHVVENKGPGPDANR